MSRVFVIGTVHEETGLASIAELLAILERINPEVIFLEIPAAAFDDHFNGTRSNLESTAVNLFRANHSVALVPVDLPTPEAAFFTDTKELVRRVTRTSPAFRRLMDLNSRATLEGGFPYLNSVSCIQSWAEIYAEELATVEYIGNAQLREFYDRWHNANENRDSGMMKNIEDYCVRHVFAQGAFLIGAGHRGSLIDKARAGRSGTVQWDFQGLLGGSQ